MYKIFRNPITWIIVALIVAVIYVFISGTANAQTTTDQVFDRAFFFRIIAPFLEGAIYILGPIVLTMVGGVLYKIFTWLGVKDAKESNDALHEVWRRAMQYAAAKKTGVPVDMTKVVPADILELAKKYFKEMNPDRAATLTDSQIEKGLLSKAIGVQEDINRAMAAKEQPGDVDIENIEHVTVDRTTQPETTATVPMPSGSVTVVKPTRPNPRR